MLPQFFVVHVEVRFKEQDCPELGSTKVFRTFQDLDIHTLFPAFVSKARGICYCSHGCIYCSKLFVLRLGLEHAKVKTRGTCRRTFLGLAPGAHMFLSGYDNLIRGSRNIMGLFKLI